MTKANDYQVDGTHYQQKGTIQHWDYAASNNFDYFQGQITKYVTRWKKKNGLKDLEKARHFIEKYIEVEKVKIQLKDAEKMKSKWPGLNPEEPTATSRIFAMPLYGEKKFEPPLYHGLLRPRDLPPKIDRTGQEKPFGYDAGGEI